MTDAYKTGGSSPPTVGSAFAFSGGSPPSASPTNPPAVSRTRHPDFVIQPEGSIFLLIPLTSLATDWLDHYLADVRHVGSAVVIENRYAFGVVQGILEDGLVVSCHEGLE